jgi:hypothetical protein
MSAPTTAKTTEESSPRLHPAQQPRDTSEDLLVLSLLVKKRSGVTAPLTLSAPAAPVGTAGWQLAHLAAYLGELHRSKQDSTSEGASGFLLARTAWTPYARNPLFDPRVTCQVEVEVGPLEENGWPAVALVVLESEPAPAPWARKRVVEGAGAVLRLAFEEIEAEHANLCSRATRSADPAVAELRDQADALLSEAGELRMLGQRLTNAEGLRKSRAAALHERVVPEPGSSLFVGLDPVPARLETLTGTIEEVGSGTGPDGQVVTLFSLSHEQGRVSTSGHELPSLLRCQLTGRSAAKAAALAPGRRVVASGRLTRQTYMPAEQQFPRSLITFDIHALGTDVVLPDPSS